MRHSRKSPPFAIGHFPALGTPRACGACQGPQKHRETGRGGDRRGGFSCSQTPGDWGQPCSVPPHPRHLGAAPAGGRLGPSAAHLRPSPRQWLFWKNRPLHPAALCRLVSRPQPVGAMSPAWAWHVVTRGPCHYKQLGWDEARKASGLTGPWWLMHKLVAGDGDKGSNPHTRLWGSPGTR